jgi:hypothetical protein
MSNTHRDNYFSRYFHFYYLIRARYNIVWSFTGVILALLSPFRRLPKNVDILFLCHDVHRHARKYDKWYSSLIDPMNEEFNSQFNCLTISTPFSKLFGRKCYGDVRIHSFKIIVAFLKRIVLYRSLNLIKVENDPLISAYYKILKHLNPKIVIGIQPSVEFCVAAKKLNIQTYDMQHGLISDVNYYAIKKRESINQVGWPDFVMCWDVQSAERLIRITEGNAKPLVTGNPSYHSNAGRDLHNSQVIVHERVYDMEILVTLTYLDYNDYHDDQNYRDIGLPTPMVNLIKSSPNVFWRLRLHPVQLKFAKKRVDSILTNVFSNNRNIDWLLYSSLSFGAAISGCNGHMTVGSASALDAFQNSVPTILIGCPGVADIKKAELYFSEYIQSGVVKFIDGKDLSSNSLDFFNSFNKITVNEIKLDSLSEGVRSFSIFSESIFNKLRK